MMQDTAPIDISDTHHHYTPAPDMEAMGPEDDDERTDFLVRVIAPIVAIFWLVVLVVLGAGCASAVDRLEDGVDAGQKALALVDVGTDKLAEAHAEAAKMAIQACALAGEVGSEKHRECLDGFGFAPEQIEDLLVTLRTVSAAYDQIAEALAVLNAAVPSLRKHAERISDVRERSK